MTAADRPSVTDNARAVREAAMNLYRAMRRANPDAWAEVDEVEDWAYWDDIVRTAQVTLAAGRAETTTATTEDAETEIWHDLLDTWGTSASGRRTMSPATARGITRHVIDALNERDLLATGHARPTREQIARAIDDEDTTPCAVCDDDWCYYCRADALRMADAVLALLADRPAGRAETTTATTEDYRSVYAETTRVIYERRQGYSAGEIAQALADAGLLATARTINAHPTYTVEYQQKIADELGVEREAVLRALGLAAPLLATGAHRPARVAEEEQ